MDQKEVKSLIEAERARQDAKWGGPSHDDRHNGHDWMGYIIEHAAKALNAQPGSAEQQQHIIEVAALGDAVCCCLLRLQGYLGQMRGFRPTHGE